MISSRKMMTHDSLLCNEYDFKGDLNLFISLKKVFFVNKQGSLNTINNKHNFKGDINLSISLIKRLKSDSSMHYPASPGRRSGLEGRRCRQGRPRASAGGRRGRRAASASGRGPGRAGCNGPGERERE